MTIMPASCSYSGPAKQQYDIYEVKVKSSLNVRERPDTKSPIIYRYSNGSHIDVIEIEGEWAKVSLTNSIGYVSAKYIEPYKLLERPARTENVQENVAGTDYDRDIADNNDISTGKPFKRAQASPDGNADLSMANDYIGDETKAVRSPDSLSYLIKLPEGLNIDLIIIDSVAPNKIFGIANELNDSIVDKHPEYQQNWFKRWTAYWWNDEEHYTLVYIRAFRLLTVGGSGNALKILRELKIDEYYGAQKIARENEMEGIENMISRLAEARMYYKDLSWVMRNELSISSPFDYLADSFILQNLLPNDTFWYKYIFRWLFFVPMRIGMFLTNLLGSFTLAFLLVIACNVLVVWRWSVYKYKKVPTFQIVAITMTIRALLLLTLIAMMLYLIPNMANVANMEASGFSHEDIDGVLRQYSHTAMHRSWWLITLFIAGGIAYMLTDDPLVMSCSLFSNKAQQTLLAMVPIQNYLTRKGIIYSSDISELQKEDKPFLKIISGKIGEKLGKSLVLTIIFAFVLNSTFLFYVMIIIWMKLLNRLIVWWYMSLDLGHKGAFEIK